MSKSLSSEEKAEVIQLRTRGVTQPELATMFGVSQSSISRTLAGSPTPLNTFCTWCNDPIPLVRGAKYCGDDCRREAQQAQKGKTAWKRNAASQALRILSKRHPEEYRTILAEQLAAYDPRRGTQEAP